MATIKQKKAFDNMVENGGSVSRAMIDADYSVATAKTPQKLTESKGWKELMDKYLPDDELAANHKELLSQKQIEYFVFPKQMDDEEIRGHVASAGLGLITIRPSEKGKLAFYSIPDAQAKKAALDMAYKLKGSYAPEKSMSLNVNIAPTNKEAKALADKYEEELKKTL